jgi:hypothetical protein
MSPLDLPTPDKSLSVGKVVAKQNEVSFSEDYREPVSSAPDKKNAKNMSAYNYPSPVNEI